MSMQLHRLDDPRDALSKAKRHELLQFARRRGVHDVRPGMPAMLMRQILREKGHTDITIPRRMLGQIGAADDRMARPPVAAQPKPPPDVPAVDALADLAQQYGEYTRPEPLAQSGDYEDMNVIELRKLCKRRGIAQQRGQRASDLRDKLKAADRGENAA